MKTSLKTKPSYVTDEKGRKTSVIIPLREYERLLEDLHDLSVVAERRDEPTISFNELKRRLQSDGLIQD